METASRWVHQLVLELPPTVASLSTATAQPLGCLIYRSPLSEWISGSVVVCGVVITVKSSLLWGITMSHPLHSGLVGFDARAGVGAGIHTKKPQRAEQTEKVWQFPNHSQRRLQRRRVCGSERREGVLCFDGSLTIIVRGMDYWTGKDLSHISYPGRTMLKRQNTHSIYFVEQMKNQHKTKQRENKIFINGPGMTLDAVFQLGNKSCLAFISLIYRLKRWIVTLLTLWIIRAPEGTCLSVSGQGQPQPGGQWHVYVCVSVEPVWVWSVNPTLWWR